MNKYSIHSQDPKYPMAERVDPVVHGFLIISQEEVIDLLRAKDARIAELELQSKSRSDTIIEYSNRIAELEKERDELKMPIDLGDRVILSKQALQAHNLEQQIKCVEHSIKLLDNWGSARVVLDAFRSQLQKQIIALKGQGDD